MILLLKEIRKFLNYFVNLILKITSFIFSILKFKMGLKTKLLTIFIGLFLFYFFIFIFTSVHYSQSIIKSSYANFAALQSKLLNTEEKIINDTLFTTLVGVVESKADYLNTYLKYVADQTEIIAHYAELIYASPGHFKKDLTKNNLRSIDLDPLYFFPKRINNAEITNDAILFKPMESLFISLFSNYQNVDSIYMATSSGLMLSYPFSILPNNYDPRKRVWFINANKTGKTGWTDTYHSVPDNRLMITCFSPIKNKNGKIFAVAGIDVSIDFLKDKIKKISTEDKGTVASFIFNSEGKVILDTAKTTNIKDEKWYENYEGYNILKSDNSIFRNHVIEMLRKKKGILTYHDKDGSYYIAYHYIPETKWIIGFIYLVSEIDKPINVMKDVTSKMFLTQSKALIKEEEKIIIIKIVISLFLLVLFILLIIYMARQFIKPILYLKDKAKLIGEGNLDLQIQNIKTGDEIESLADTINKMTTDLKKYIEDLNIKVKQEEKINSELTLAYDIQKSVLPQAFPETDQLDFAVLSKPARIIGGDYYDFFKLPNDKIGILIADVIGKGIPAALYMVIVESIIHSHILDYDSPRSALEKINFIMSKNPVLVKYVPLFYGIIDLKTLEFKYCNAGHEPILRYHNDEFQVLDTDGFPLGAFDEAAYEEGSITLVKDDIVAFYTDGITEARNLDQVDFGINGLKDSITLNKNLSSTEIVNAILNDIEIFSKGAVQHDDLTLLILKIN